MYLAWDSDRLWDCLPPVVSSKLKIITSPIVAIFACSGDRIRLYHLQDHFLNLEFIMSRLHD